MNDAVLLEGRLETSERFYRSSAPNTFIGCHDGTVGASNGHNLVIENVRILCGAAFWWD